MRIMSACLKAAACVIVAAAISCPAAARELSLAEAVETALENNPTIAASELSAGAAEQTARGARKLANPELSVAPDVAGTAGADSAVFFSQPLEINGSRRIRTAVASHLSAAASYDAAAICQEIVFQVTLAYWDLAKAQELVTAQQENLDYVRTINQSVQKQLDVGAVPGVQVVKTEVELARARQELARSEMERSHAQAALSALLGLTDRPELAAVDSFEFREVDTDSSSLKSSALRSRPEVRAQTERAAAARGEVKAAGVRSMPDVSIQARRESFGSEGDSGVAIVLNLPILDWGSAKADRRRAELEAQSAERQLRAVETQVALEVEQAIRQVEVSADIVSEYRSGILTKSEELAAAAKKGYEKGATSYLDVLEAMRTFRNARTDYVSALADHAKSVARLDRAVGRGPTALDVLEEQQ